MKRKPGQSHEAWKQSAAGKYADPKCTFPACGCNVIDVVCEKNRPISKTVKAVIKKKLNDKTNNTQAPNS